MKIIFGVPIHNEQITGMNMGVGEIMEFPNF